MFPPVLKSQLNGTTHLAVLTPLILLIQLTRLTMAPHWPTCKIAQIYV